MRNIISIKKQVLIVSPPPPFSNPSFPSYRSIADKQLPNFCLRFAHVRKQELEEKRLKYNFISHVIYMCDIGLVPPSTITEVNKALHSTRC